MEPFLFMNFIKIYRPVIAETEITTKGYVISLIQLEEWLQKESLWRKNYFRHIFSRLGFLRDVIGRTLNNHQ